MPTSPAPAMMSEMLIEAESQEFREGMCPLEVIFIAVLVVAPSRGAR